MQDKQEDKRGALRWALPVSVATHLAAVALLVFGLPQSASNPAQEQTINVELVPPPQKPPEKPKPPEPPPEAPKPPEKQPEPPKSPQPVQEPPKAAEPPPQAPAPPRQAEAAEPEPEQPASARAPLPVLQPVVQFGDKDSGPRKALDGDSAEDGETALADQPDPMPSEPAKPDPTQAKEKPGKSGIALADPPKAAEPRQPEADSKPSKRVPRTKAKTLFSRAMTNDPQAMTAMGKIPRDRRGGTLCGTELRAQLVNASPPHFPDMLPSVRLTTGTVIEVQAAFHAAGAWRSVSYRCQVDDKATKVVSFSLGIGDLIPRSEWSRLGLPSP